MRVHLLDDHGYPDCVHFSITLVVVLVVNRIELTGSWNSAGLKPSGASDGDCSQSTGQVYVRGGYYESNYGIMYAW